MLRRQDWLTFTDKESSEPRSIAALVVPRGTVRVVSSPSDLVRTHLFKALQKPHPLPALQVETSYGVSFQWLAPRVVTLAQELALAIGAPVFISGSRWWEPPALPDDRALGRAIEVSRSFDDDEAWALLGFALAGAECLELAESNPMLAALVGSAERLGEHRRSRLPVAAVAPVLRELARRPRHEILDCMGFPRSRSLVRLLARVAAAPASFSTLWSLARSPLPARAAKILIHLPRLTSTALRLATSPLLWSHVGDQLLREAAEAADDGMIPFDMEDALRMARRLGRPHAVGAVRSRAELEQLHDALTELCLADRVPEAAPGSLDAPLVAPPPDTPTIQRLATAEALRDEGRELQHCVGTYDRRVERGEVAVYRLLQPERATLCLRWRPARGTWDIAQLRGFKNQPVAPPTEAAVRDWLADSARN